MLPRLLVPFNSYSGRAPRDPSELAVSPELVKALVAAGFHSIQRGRAREAKPIFDFVAWVRPDRDFAAIGQAFAAMSDGRPVDAEALLAEARRRMPDSEDLKVFHVFALMLAGRATEAGALQSALIESSSDASRCRLLRALGEEISLRLTPLHTMRPAMYPGEGRHGP